jgi:hypothetical protein
LCACPQGAGRSFIHQRSLDASISSHLSPRAKVSDGSRDLIMAAVALPPDADGGSYRTAMESDHRPTLTHRLALAMAEEDAPKSLGDVSSGRLARAVEQVERMMVGGLSVCGLYVVSDDAAKKALEVCSSANDVQALCMQHPVNSVHDWRLWTRV